MKLFDEYDYDYGPFDIKIIKVDQNCWDYEVYFQGELLADGSRDRKREALDSAHRKARRWLAESVNLHNELKKLTAKSLTN